MGKAALHYPRVMCRRGALDLIMRRVLKMAVRLAVRKRRVPCVYVADLYATCTQGFREYPVPRLFTHRMKCRGRNRRKPLGFRLVAIGFHIRHRLQPSLPMGRPSQTERAPAHGVRLLLRGREQMPSPSVTMCGGGTDSRSRWGLWVGHQFISSSSLLPLSEQKEIRSKSGANES